MCRPHLGSSRHCNSRCRPGLAQRRRLPVCTIKISCAAQAHPASSYQGGRPPAVLSLVGPDPARARGQRKTIGLPPCTKSQWQAPPSSRASRRSNKSHEHEVLHPIAWKLVKLVKLIVLTDLQRHKQEIRHLVSPSKHCMPAS